MAWDAFQKLERDIARGLGDERFSIGHMALLNGVTVKTLRLYQQKGLLEPEGVDEPTGYRYYSLGQCARLDAITQLKTLGMSLDEIGQILDSAERGGTQAAYALQSRLCAQMDELDAREREVAFAKALGRSLLGTCRCITQPPLCDEFIFESIPNRPALLFDIPTVGPVDADNMQWERAVRIVKMRLARNGYPMALLNNVSGIIRKEDLLKGSPISRTAVVFVDPCIVDYFGDAVSVVPGGTHLVLYRRHSLGDNGLSSEYPLVLDMLAYARDRDLQIAGDYVGETLADTPLFSYRGRDTFIKLELPVTRV